ncbi:HEPN domain-containing protein [Vibrio penaeicida]|uniref:HEPN domain-containing protein n=1 Tax=Vibrio penaeicida TaxID=104609 RepID=UPI000CE9BCE2|nr:HEPN domain-containing protein [Vibrio penaeicida]
MSKIYSIPEELHKISVEDLKLKSTVFQKEIIRQWFFENYQDPVHDCPYNSREGGYIYIHGGPYEAGDELFSEFGDELDEKIIQEVADELDEDGIEWSGIPRQEDFDDYFYDTLGTASEPFKEFENAVNQLRDMLDIETSSAHQQTLLKMVYVNVITSLEAFLSDLFITKLESDDFYLRRFVESNPEFKKDKLPLSDIFKQYESLNGTVKEYLVELLWHNLPKLRPMFKATFEIEFPSSIELLIKATHKRHDLVHRAGKTKDGELINITVSEVSTLINEVLDFAKHINDQLGVQPEF